MTRSVQRLNQKAFALPTVLIGSVVMIIVMLAAITATVSVSSAINAQYYNKLSLEAGESGIAMAVSCIDLNDTATWLSPLRPGTDCSGNGYNPNSTSGYVLSATNIRTSFSVATPTVGADGTVQLVVTSTSELLRSSNGLPWKTQAQTTAARLTSPSFDISSGNDTTCATVNGGLWCWGANNTGQIGDGTTTNRSTPFNVNTGALAGQYIYKATSGFSHTCAVAGPSSVPIAKSATNPGVYCWGDNSIAQLGIGTITNSASYLIPIPAATSLPNGRTYVDISASNISCAIGNDATATSRKVWCWGDNATGQAGDNITNVTKKTPYEGTINADEYAVRYELDNSATDSTAHSTVLDNATQINHVNSSAGCALTTTYLVWCWGTNASGNLGINVTNNTGVNNRWRARAAGATNANPDTTSYRFTKVVTNFGRVCAIGKNNAGVSFDGKVYCWGANGDDSNGIIDYRTSSTTGLAYQWPDVKDMVTTGTQSTSVFTDIALADWATCVLRSDGNVYCWGYNDVGQLGSGTITATPVPSSGVTPGTKPIAPTAMVQATGPLAGKIVTKLTSGNNHFCAMTTTGASYCWGRNDLGQLGDGTTVNKATPTRTKVPIIVTTY